MCVCVYFITLLLKHDCDLTFMKVFLFAALVVVLILDLLKQKLLYTHSTFPLIEVKDLDKFKTGVNSS